MVSKAATAVQDTEASTPVFVADKKLLKVQGKQNELCK